MQVIAAPVWSGGRLERAVCTLAQLEPAIGSHGADVAEIALAFGERLELSAPDLSELEFAARLHDVGKLRVPPEILRKADALSESEWALMRLHPLWGEEIVADIPGLEAVAPIVRSHHEHWDGGGYPDGLFGERIPLASRIIAICDAFCAMTVSRPYRHPLDDATALQELAAAAGSQFDPHLTAEFIQAIAPRTRETA
jgi:two-component system, cell cycle response regulator